MNKDCNTCEFLDNSGKYQNLFYCGIAHAQGVRQPNCKIDPERPITDCMFHTVRGEE